MPNIIDSIQISSSTFDVRDKSATTVVNLTQDEYDNLPSSAKTANVLYNITDASPIDISQYWTSAETQSAITEATSGKADTSYVDQSVSGKVDTSTFEAYSGNVETALSGKQDTLSAGTGIDITDNVISATGGGGKAVTGGTNISVTTGETADTINCTLPIKSEVNNTSIYFGTDNWGSASGGRNLRIGYNASAFGDDAICLATNSTTNGSSSFIAGGRNNTINGAYDFIGAGLQNITNNDIEAAFGYFNNSIKTTSGWFPYSSGNTLFSVGNGTSSSARHNAFEIRQNGDIYITSGGTDILLQDYLGGGIDSGTVQTMIDESISGKTNQSDFVSHSGNTSIHVTTAQTAAWDAKSDFSGSYNDLTDKPTIPIVPTNVSSFNNDAGYITSNDISGKTNQSDFTAHTANTTVHVTSAEKATWNAKSDFSGNYNDLSNKPTIPTSASQLTNDSGYITSSALDGYATEAYVTAATNDMATKTWVGQQGYLTQHQDISGKQDVSGMTAYTTTATTNTLSGTVTAHTASTTIHVTAQDKTNWNNKSDFSGDYNDLTNKPTIPTVPTNVSDFTNDAGYITIDAISGKVDTTTFNTYSGNVETALSGKQDTLSAGTGIDITDNVISATGGGGKAVSAGTNISITTGETADTINCTLPFSYEGDNLKTTVSGNSFADYFHYGQIFGTDNKIQGRNSAVGEWGWQKNTTIIGYSNQSLRMDNSIIIGSSNNLGNIFGINKNNYIFGFSNTVNPVNTQDNIANNNFVIGNNNTINQKSNNFIFGYGIKPSNNDEFSLGKYNNSVSASTTFGDSGNTLFSVGNGTADNARHNAFEIRQNGDIYITLDGQDVKLQDQLGGGGSSYIAGDGIDITNDVISVTGKTDTSAFTAHTADTVIHVTSAEKATWDAKSDFSGSYNDLTDKPTIPTVPTSNTAFTNDAGYITSSALDGYATTAATSALNNTLTAHTADTTVHTTAAEKTSWNGAVTNASNAVTALGGLKLVKLTQAQYDALATKDSNTLYVING